MKEKIIVNNFFVQLNLVDKIETIIVEIYFGNARTCFKKTTNGYLSKVNKSKILLKIIFNTVLSHVFKHKNHKFT